MTEIEQTGMTGIREEGSLAHRDLALILLGASLLGASIFATEYLDLPRVAEAFLIGLRLVLGLVYVFYVSGYCLTVILFPRNDDLDGLERAGLSLGLSVAWVPVLALALDRLPWGLSLPAILIGQLASLVLFALLIVWRREQLPPDKAFAPGLSLRPRSRWQALPQHERRVFLFGLDALLAAAVIATLIMLFPSPREYMTEFYILGEQGRAEAYPRQAVAGQELSLRMGIANHERESMSYRVEVWASDPWNDREQLVGEAGPLTLSPGQTAEQEIVWEMPWAGDDLVTDFHLYTASGAEPYRTLRLWLEVGD